MAETRKIAAILAADVVGYSRLARAVGRIREIAPQLTVKSLRDFLSGFFVPEALAHQVDGLAEAGLAQE